MITESKLILTIVLLLLLVVMIIKSTTYLFLSFSHRERCNGRLPRRIGGRHCHVILVYKNTNSEREDSLNNDGSL